MAATPGFLTNWPWKPLGNFKHVVLVPWVVKSVYNFITMDVNTRDSTTILIFLLLLTRMLHNQIWISFSRYKTAKGQNRIVDKNIEFEQVDRERNWDDQIILTGLLYYLVNYYFEGAQHLPIWRLDGVTIIIVLHAGPVEFLYYWFHRALHHHFLYNRYHSHHHSSIVTEPITSVIHPFAEHIVYFALFAIPLMTVVLCGKASMATIAGYHSLHHTQFRTNYSLFMPFYDYIHGTMDKSTDMLYEKSLKQKEESPHVVHLTHLTTPKVIYHMRLGFASLASKPHTSSKWYLWILSPITFLCMLITRVYGKTFVIERNVFKDLKLQTWTIPKYRTQYLMQGQRQTINGLIEDAILDAEAKGVKVLTLGLLNQREEFNNSGELFIRRNPKLKVKLVDGSSLVVAVVVNNIPRGTTQVVFRGNFNKIACYLALALCQKGIQVAVSREKDCETLKSKLNSVNDHDKLSISHVYSHKTWLVGEGLTKEEQMKASKGTIIIPYSQFPPKKVRKDCVYYTTPSMLTPKYLENVDSCENWLPRRVLSAWRIAGILHGLEDWKVNECGEEVFNIDKIWEASIRHGFSPS
ncbi:very-long-chain aldehyde decarbonylase CER1 isoform X2 [Helianthus annuus]|uniref:very-long-chain aldehyde decarbonylase CER1 isoform X2 n=1 Tax=Helianthus annuus TaxID=4232 RepID=UPI000B8F5605|nr:very-long-chain aldehyde decarbonylase CER1 isoform X2 [Helianthus annuus]